MWDPRFPELAAARLQEQRRQAAVQGEPAGSPGRLRRRTGALLVRLGERLAASPPASRRPAAAAR